MYKIKRSVSFSSRLPKWNTEEEMKASHQKWSAFITGTCHLTELMPVMDLIWSSPYEQQKRLQTVVIK